MQSSKLTPLLNVRSCTESIAFYAKLGFQVVNSWQDGGVTRFARIGNDCIEIMLNQPSDAQAPRGDAPYSGMILFFNVASVHTLHTELRAKGLAPGEPTNESYGVDEMHLRDPDGYWLAFSSPLSVSRSSVA